MCAAAHALVPELFSAQELSHVHRGANDAIRRSNNRKFLRALTDYYDKHVHVSEEDLELPDTMDLVRGSVSAVRRVCVCVPRDGGRE